MKTRTRIIAAGVVSAVTLMAFPLVVEAATADTTISSVVSPVISLTTSGTVNLNVTPTASGVQTTDKDIVSVSTNDVSGYTLQLNTKTATTTLVSGGNTIAASTATPGSPAALNAGHWGFRVDGLSSFGAGPTSAGSNTAIGAVTYAGVPASGSPVTLKTTAATASGDATNVWYSVAADSSQPTGTYTQQVTYTATAN